MNRNAGAMLAMFTVRKIQAKYRTYLVESVLILPESCKEILQAKNLDFGNEKFQNYANNVTLKS